MWLLILGVLQAAAPETRVWLGGEMSFAAGPWAPSSLGGGVGGRIGVSLGPVPHRSLGLQVRAREVLVSNDLREATAIDLMARYPSGIGPYAAIGFAHHHESPFDVLLTDPIGVVAGTAKGITHRSGIAAGGGWEFGSPFPEVTFINRLRPFVDVSAAWLPDAVRPSVYVFLDVGINIGVGKLIRSE